MTLRRLWTCESLDPFRQGNSETKQNHESIWIYCHIAKFCRSSFCGFPMMNPESVTNSPPWTECQPIFCFNHQSWNRISSISYHPFNQNKSNKPINQSINHSMDESHRIHPMRPIKISKSTKNEGKYTGPIDTMGINQLTKRKHTYSPEIWKMLVGYEPFLLQMLPFQGTLVLHVGGCKTSSCRATIPGVLG